MAKAKSKDENATESVSSILGKIKNVVTGKEKPSISEEELTMAVDADDEEPMELTEMVETEQPAEEQPSAEQAASEEADILAKIAESLKAADSAGAEEAQEKPAEEEFVDVLKEIDQAIADDTTMPAEQPVVMEEPAPSNANLAQELVENTPEVVEIEKKEFPEANSQNIITETSVNMAENKKENILSEEIAAKSSNAIQNLLNNIPKPDIASPAFRSAVTIEDVVAEMLKPMLKEWLDKNLEVIVRDIVDKEIKKIIPRD